MTEKMKTVKRISLIVGLAVLAVAILVNFLPILNIKLEGVESDYTFDAPGGHDFLGWQAIYYWWGPSILIGGSSAFNFNIWLFLGMILPVVFLIVDSAMLKKALYRKKATVELIAAAATFFGAFIYASAPFFAAKTVGNLLVSHMKMAIEQGTYTLGWFSYVMVAAMLIGCAVKVVGAVFSLQNEAEAAKEAAAAAQAQDPAVAAKKRRVRATAPIAAVMAVLLVFAITAQTLINAYSGFMDSFFGRAEVTVTKSEEAENLDGEAYYEFTTHTGEEARNLAAEVNNEVVSEGVVLLKNEGALPLAKDAKITLLGVNTLACNDIIQNALDQGMVVGQAEVPLHNPGPIAVLEPNIDGKGLRLPMAAGDLDIVSAQVTVDDILAVDDVLAVGLAAKVIEQILLPGRQVLGDIEFHNASPLV